MLTRQSEAQVLAGLVRAADAGTVDEASLAPPLQSAWWCAIHQGSCAIF